MLLFPYFKSLCRCHSTELGGIHALHGDGTRQEVSWVGDINLILEVVFALLKTVDVAARVGSVDHNIIVQSLVPAPTGTCVERLDTRRTAVDELKVFHRTVTGDIDTHLDFITHLQDTLTIQNILIIPIQECALNRNSHLAGGYLVHVVGELIVNGAPGDTFILLL